MNKRKTGQEQEVKAACFLKTQGYQILERNYRCKKGEIDLIAREGQYLVFVEVKYRSTNESGLPEEAVDLRKQRQISRVAAWYLTEKGLDIYTPCRSMWWRLREKRSGFTGMHFSTRVKRRNPGGRNTCKYGKKRIESLSKKMKYRKQTASIRK